MRREIDQKLKETIINYLNKTYFISIKKNSIKTYFGDEIFGPHQVQSELINLFNIDTDWAHLLLYQWVFENGMENIENVWLLCHFSLEIYEPNGNGRIYAPDVLENQTYFYGIDVANPESGSTYVYSTNSDGQILVTMDNSESEHHTIDYTITNWFHPDNSNQLFD